MHCASVHANQKLNHLIAEMDSLYHFSARKLGMTDSMCAVLYAIYTAEGDCLLRDVYKNCGIRKQTAHSAIQALEQYGILYFEPCGGNQKKVMLTLEGERYLKRTVGRLYQAETAAFDAWTEEEIRTYLRLFEKYVDCFRTQVENL